MGRMGGKKSTRRAPGEGTEPQKALLWKPRRKFQKEGGISVLYSCYNKLPQTECLSG